MVGFVNPLSSCDHQDVRNPAEHILIIHSDRPFEWFHAKIEQDAFARLKNEGFAVILQSNGD